MIKIIMTKEELSYLVFKCRADLVISEKERLYIKQLWDKDILIGNEEEE